MSDFNNLETAKRRIRPKFELIHFYKAVEEVRGAAKLEEAKNKRSEIGKHIIEVLEQLDVLSQEESADLVVAAFSQEFDNLKKVSFSDLRIEKHTVYLRNEEVTPCLFPTVGQDSNFAILKYDDFKRYEQYRETMSERVAQQAKKQEKQGILKNSSDANFSFDDILYDGIVAGASDIHITFGEDRYSVHFRVDGLLVKQTNYLMKGKQGKDLAYAIQNIAADATKGAFNPDIFYKAQDARIDYDKYHIDLRLATMPDGNMDNSSMTLRLLKKASIKGGVCNFVEDFGYGSVFEKDILRYMKRKGGLIIASGITGSGKSTLLINLMGGIPPYLRGYTIEDPVEARLELEHVTQHGIYEPKSNDKDEQDKKMDFMRYVRALKRSDPDIILFGEIRNEKNLIKGLVEITQSGQLILTSVHIKSGFDIFFGLENIFDIPYKISVQLVLFSVNQTLARELCSECKKPDIHGKNIAALREMDEADEIPYSYTKPLTSFISDPNVQGKTFIKGGGCDKCKGTGYFGRIPIYEYFRMTQPLKEELLKKELQPHEIEEFVCQNNIGHNKLGRLIELIREGRLDASEETLMKIY